MFDEFVILSRWNFHYFKPVEFDGFGKHTELNVFKQILQEKTNYE